MLLCQLLLHIDNAFDCLIELGHHGGLQFNNVYEEDHLVNGYYTRKVQQCQDLLRIVTYLREQLQQLNIKEIYYPDVDKENRPSEADIQRYETVLKQLQVETHAIMEHFQTLERRKYYVIEKSFALMQAHKLLAQDATKSGDMYTESIMLELLKDQSESPANASQLNYMVGSIEVSKLAAFELLAYRLFGRNLLLQFVPMPEPIMERVGNKQMEVHKHVIFMITGAAQIRPKLLKCCHAFHVNVFECPELPRERLEMIEQLEQELKDLDKVLDATRSARKRALRAAATDVFIMSVNLHKALQVYDLMNRLNPVGGREHEHYLQAECFVPEQELPLVRAALHRGLRLSEQDSERQTTPPILLPNNRKTQIMPPTYFRLNKFTQGFQNLIDSYGMADYKELNPAPYTIITFPFLFAIMFGDLVHGLLLCLFAGLLIYKERQIERQRKLSASENEILNILFAGRYIILLMGIFSMYVGIIYNDVASKAMNIFGSSWSCVYNASTIRNMRAPLSFNPNDAKFYSGDPYALGVDPVWKLSGEDSITTFNSLKMKLAIIFGVSQMIFGLVLAAVDCVLLNRLPDLFLVVIPQFIFMICIFGYLVFLVFFKWLTYGGLKPMPRSSNCAPSVLITFIDMMLMKTSVLENPECLKGMFPHERTVEFALFGIGFAAVPVLLCGKPIYLMRKRKRLRREQQQQRDLSGLRKSGRNTLDEMRSAYNVDSQTSRNSQPAKLEPRQSAGHDDAEFDMSEIWIHSGIHTIECVLGSVSHTASYLRLWALSLAHSQLADVLWDMVLQRGLKNKGAIYIALPMLLATFFVWAVLTVAILVMMEGLSAFLHTLRLHWVEFQSKFFNGAGVPFMPFYFPPSTIRS
ncbi:Vha100-3 [Drosophila busckii]|uniref:V-type proton ATPase subunit a n=2 Tax=Drosophila busckii TaxID=30019 RepID=A0A0M4EIH4_DROBS|nr:Vha100-3 [Drosophila busckii]